MKIGQKAFSSVFKCNSMSFSIGSKLREFIKSKREQLYKRENLLDSLKIFNDTDQFVVDDSPKIDQHKELAQSDSELKDKYLVSKKRKALKLSPIDKDKLVLIDEIMHKIKKTGNENQIKTMSNNEILSLWDKLDYYETNSAGKIINPHLNKIDPAISSDHPKSFDSIEVYNLWKEDIKKKIRYSIQIKLNPMEYYVTQGKHTERAFTGYYTDHYDVGTYSCKVCTQVLFSSTHKYQSDSGWPAFWNFLPFSILFKEDSIDNYKTPTQAILPIQYVGNKPLKRICCSHVSIFY